MKIENGLEHLDEVKRLILEYCAFLGRDLSFQNIDKELADLPAKYAPPEGRLLCAVTDGGEVIGCAAYHRHSRERCEMKRLFVRPEHRELHAGRTLIEAILSQAREDGFTEMVPDTVTPLQGAIHLYKKYGFEECEPYYHNPMSDVIYMKKKL